MYANLWFRHVLLPFIIVFLTGLFLPAFAGTVSNPCTGTGALLNILDRPTLADSACVVPFKKTVLESGYEYEWLSHSSGRLQNYPEVELRIGLPADNEFSIIMPNYFHPSLTSVPAGFSAMVLGMKHEIGYNGHWLAAIDGDIILPNGSAVWGSEDVGVVINGIINYNINSQYTLSFVLGPSSQTQASSQGGKRFTSINPDLVLTYAPFEKINFYFEIYGSSKTGPDQSSGFNADGGVIYLFTQSIAVDLEMGQRLSGELGGFNHYAGTGISFMF